MSDYLDQVTVGSTTYDIKDSDAQRKTIEGSGAPLSSTVGSVGLHYFDTTATSAPYEYVCTAASNNVYTWMPAGYGEDGSPGVYYGTTQPSDPDIKVWIDPSGDPDSTTIPSGGTAGQVLIKASASNYDIMWGEDTSRLSKTGDTMTGSLNIKASDLTSGQASDVYTDTRLILRDKNNVEFGYVQAFTEAGWDDNNRQRQGIQLVAKRTIDTGSGTSEVYNGILLTVKENGERAINFHDWPAWRVALGLAYVPNETLENIGSSAIVLNGYCTNDATGCYLVITTEKSLETINTITLTAMTGRLRGVNGYIEGDSDINFYTDSNYQKTCTKLTNNLIKIYIKKSSALSGATANTPVVYNGTLALEFT